MVKQVQNVKRNTFENLEAPDYVWKSGKFIPWDKATFHISMLGWSSINMVFEGIRAYYNENDADAPVYRNRKIKRSYIRTY